MELTTTAQDLETLLTALERFTRLPSTDPQHMTLPKGPVLTVQRDSSESRFILDADTCTLAVRGLIDRRTVSTRIY